MYVNPSALRPRPHGSDDHLRPHLSCEGPGGKRANVNSERPPSSLAEVVCPVLITRT